jgi:hypothetical protein
VVVAAQVTVFHVDPSRASSVAQDLVDAEAGTILTTDRYKGYLFWLVERRQLCWAHTIRTQSLVCLLRRCSRWPRSVARVVRRSGSDALRLQSA